MSFSLNELIDRYSQVVVAKPEDNEAILEFIENIPMKMERGGLRFDRRPNFFSLHRVQAENSITFLFMNQDNSIGGLGCIAITPMVLKGQPEYLGYTSDLRFSPTINRETRQQFFMFYAELIKHFREFEEFKGCRFIVSSIFDENIAAIKSLVSKRNRKRTPLVHRPFFSYHNVNVLARLPGFRRKVSDLKVEPANNEDQLLSFLLTNTEDSEIVWSEQELLRRQKKLGFQWSDFIIAKDAKGEIQAATLLLTDQAYRKARISNIPAGIKVGSQLMALLGRPSLSEKEPVKTSYLGLMKIKQQDPFKRTHLVAGLTHHFFDVTGGQNKKDSFHSLTLMEPQYYNMPARLKKYGLMNVDIPSTIYQVIHKDHYTRKDLFYPARYRRPDFDVTFS